MILVYDTKFAPSTPDPRDEVFGRCPECGRNDQASDGPGGVRTYFCSTHKNMWVVPASPNTEVWTDPEAIRAIASMREASGPERRWTRFTEETWNFAVGCDWTRPTLFDLGDIFYTPGTGRLTHRDMYVALARHHRGEWGDVGEADRQENDLSVKEGFRILSAYRGENGTKFWVITEADRSVTTVLLPEEY